MVEQWLVPTEARLIWARTRLEKAYAKAISEAFKANDLKNIGVLQTKLRFEMDIHDEEVDAYMTRRFLSEARRLKVPIPSRIKEDNS
jgi:translation initiation factor IF-3